MDHGPSSLFADPAGDPFSVRRILGVPTIVGDESGLPSNQGGKDVDTRGVALGAKGNLRAVGVDCWGWSSAGSVVSWRGSPPATWRTQMSRLPLPARSEA